MNNITKTTKIPYIFYEHFNVHWGPFHMECIMDIYATFYDAALLQMPIVHLYSALYAEPILYLVLST